MAILPTHGVLLISGVPGAGKTTVSNIVAASLPKAAVVHGDDVHDLVASGRVYPNEQPLDEADRQLLLRDRNIASLVENFADAGIFVIVDDTVVYRERLDRLVGMVHTRPIYVAVLAPPRETVHQRDAGRAEKTVFSIWAHLDEVMRTEMDGVCLWLDSEAITPEETARAVLERAWSEGLLLA